MTKVNMTTDLDVAADELWDLIGGFDAMPDWHPAIEKSELQEEGQKRKLSLSGGGTIIEKLVKNDPDERVYSYTIEDSPLPFSNYIAELRVKDNGEGKSSVEWSSEFKATDAPESEVIDIVQGVYQAGFDNLKKMFGG